jgi:hypothetical protein
VPINSSQQARKVLNEIAQGLQPAENLDAAARGQQKENLEFSAIDSK